MGYSDALASIAAVSSAAAFYALQMVTTQYSARLARRVAVGWVGLGPLLLIGLFVASMIWPQLATGRIFVLAGLVTVVWHLWWVATSVLSDRKLLHAALPHNAAKQVLQMDIVVPKDPPMETTDFTEIVPVLDFHPIPKPWIVEPQPWPGGPTSDADPLQMLVDLLIGAVRQYNTALIDEAFDTLLTLMRDVIQHRGSPDEYLALIFERVLQASPNEGFVHDRINIWLAHAVVLVLPVEYPSELLHLIEQQWAYLWARRDMEHLSDGWSILTDGMTTSSNTTWNVLAAWVRWTGEWIARNPWPGSRDDLYSTWSRAFEQLCNLALASDNALQDACEMAPHVIEELVRIPSMDTLPVYLVVDLTETLVQSYQLDQLRNDHCTDAINGLTTMDTDGVSTEGFSNELPAVLIDHAFQIFALQATLPIDAYCLGHSAGDMARWLSIHASNKRSLVSRGITAMHTPLWGLPWRVFQQGIQAWVWYLARSRKIRFALSPYATWHVRRRQTRQPQFISTLMRASDEYRERQTRQLNEMMD